MNTPSLLAGPRRRRTAGWPRSSACLAGCMLAFAGAAARADPPRGPAPPVHAAWAFETLHRASPAQLQAAYLHCDRLAMTVLLDFGTATECSIIYEALKERVFGGDFLRLLAWNRQQHAAHPPAQPGPSSMPSGGKE